MLNDRYGEEREDFELFCIEHGRLKTLNFAFEYDYENRGYLDPRVEDAFQVWFHAWGFGFNEGALFHKIPEAQVKMALDFTDSTPQLKPEATVADYVALTNVLITDKKDTRIGIDDKIDPALLKKKMRDWEAED